MNIYTAIEDDTQSFYNKTLLVRAIPNLLHDKFGQQKPLPTKINPQADLPALQRIGRLTRLRLSRVSLR